MHEQCSFDEEVIFFPGNQCNDDWIVKEDDGAYSYGDESLWIFFKQFLDQINPNYEIVDDS